MNGIEKITGQIDADIQKEVDAILDQARAQVREIEANPEDGTFGVFVFIGYDPQSKVFEGKVNMEHGYIVTDEDMKTNIPGVFAAGDI